MGLKAGILTLKTKSSSFQAAMHLKDLVSKGTRSATALRREKRHESVDCWWLSATQKPSRQSSSRRAEEKEEEEAAAAIGRRRSLALHSLLGCWLSRIRQEAGRRRDKIGWCVRAKGWMGSTEMGGRVRWCGAVWQVTRCR